MESTWKSQHPFQERTAGPHKRRWQATRRRDADPLVMRKMPHLDVTVSDTYATSHLTLTSTEAGEAANRAAANKRTKYSTIAKTHAFVAVSLESSGAWSSEGLEFITELGRRMTNTTLDKLETSYLFQRIS